MTSGTFPLYVAALERPARGPVSFTVGSFNFGIMQDMMTSRSRFEYNQKLQSVIVKIVHEAHCDLAFGCEVGGFREGSTAQTSACMKS